MLQKLPPSKEPDKRKRPPTPRYPNSTKTQRDQVVHPRPTLVRPNLLRIAFAGKICSGKTTMARRVQALSQKHHVSIERIAFGDYVKDVAKPYFGYDDTKYADRELLVDIDTNMRAIRPDVWVDCLRRKILNSDCHNWVVDDVQHTNEAEMLRSMGFTIFRIDIPESVRIERLKQTYSDYNSAKHQDTECEQFEVDTVLSHTESGVVAVENYVSSLVS